MIQDLKKNSYTKTWESATDFPTHQSVESVVRADRQYLFEEIRQWLNGVLDNMLAENLPFATSEGIPAENIQAAITNIKQQLDAAVISGIVPDGSITTAKLDDGSVTETKLANGAVSAAKLGSDVHLLEDLSVTQEKLAIPAVGTQQIINYAVTSAKLSSNAVTETKIADGSVTTYKIANGAVTAEKAPTLQKKRIKVNNAAIVFSNSTTGILTNADIGADSAVIIDPMDYYYDTYYNNKIRPMSQSIGQISFRSVNTLNTTVYVTLIILN